MANYEQILQELKDTLNQDGKTPEEILREAWELLKSLFS